MIVHQKAVSILSDVRLNRDYPSKILQAISLSDDATQSILKYVRTAKPLLTEPIDIDTYTTALAESSLLEAWQFQRTFPEVSETRPRLVHKILEWCLSRMYLFIKFLFPIESCIFSSSAVRTSRSTPWISLLELRAITDPQICPPAPSHSSPILRANNTRPCLCSLNP